MSHQLLLRSSMRPAIYLGAFRAPILSRKLAVPPQGQSGSGQTAPRPDSSNTLIVLSALGALGGLYYYYARGQPAADREIARQKEEEMKRRVRETGEAGKSLMESVTEQGRHDYGQAKAKVQDATAAAHARATEARTDVTERARQGAHEAQVKFDEFKDNAERKMSDVRDRSEKRMESGKEELSRQAREAENKTRGCLACRIRFGGARSELVLCSPRHIQIQVTKMSALQNRVVLVGVGGATCSGKTTVAKHLRNILPNSVIIHQDPEDLIPIHPVYNVGDWDSPQGAIDWPRLRAFLKKVKADGVIPPDHRSHDHLNEQKKIPLTDSAYREFRNGFQEVEEEQRKKGIRIIWGLVDGFLLYWDKVLYCDSVGDISLTIVQEVIDQLDIRFFLRVPHDVLKQRRLERHGYHTAGTHTFLGAVK
ncbi:hypothetical protein JVU11DRAFT_10577 [Chiua virens]|nr:hypothetical protein JVU11DRAFT_10577 [Chiua virens]